MKISPRRAARIRDEMRLWLRNRHGIRTTYSKSEIDAGREDLGFAGADDALIAYTLFGGELMPDMLDTIDLPVSPDDIAAIIEVASDSGLDAAEWLAED
jgi:hypothetical protein